MKPSTAKSNIVLLVSCLYILLFTYAALNKVLDYQNFTTQLGQSPLLSAFAIPVSYAVPSIELLIVIGLAIPLTRYVSLMASFVLMLMFTAYIFIILNYASFVPCSCGGIIEKMNWEQHLVFNFCFVLLSLVGIWLHPNARLRPRRTFGLLILLGTVGVTIVLALYAASEDTTHYHNKFIRRLSKSPATQIRDIDLRYNSYYFAGIDEDFIYLGNNTAQLLMTTVNRKTGRISEKQITLDNTALNFRAVTIRVKDHYFFAFDGTIPAIFSGKTSDWKGSQRLAGSEYFSLAVPIDSSAMIVRTQKRRTGESIMGKVSLLSKANTQLNKNLLQKQFDGLFDTDGSLLYSNKLNRMLYLYAYRNQFLVADANLRLDFAGNTIDTIATANLKVTVIENRHEKKLAQQPLLVNKAAAISENLLFVNSNIPGRFESRDMWKMASIIDVYDITSNSYLESFYSYDHDGRKLRNLIAQGSELYALTGRHLLVYKLNPILTNHYKSNSKGIKH